MSAPEVYFKMFLQYNPALLAPERGGYFPDLVEDVDVGFRQGYAAARHYAVGDVAELLVGHLFKSTGRRAFAEAGHEGAGESGAVEVDADTHYGGCVEGTSDADFGVVAHYQAAELEVGPHEGMRGVVPYSDFRIVVLEVG